MQDLNNKVAVITGAAEGIGKAIAQHAARRGMKLVLADLNARTLQATADEFAAQGVDLVAHQADVSNPDQLEALAQSAFDRFGAVHLLVNNAGVALAKTVWDTTQKDWDWVMGVNLYGVTNSLRAFIPRMLDSGEAGHVVNVASMAGLLSEPGLAAYNASKFAVVTVSEGLHHDLTLRNAPIKVSVLCPGWVKTRIAEAERHRDPDDRSNPAELDGATLKVGMAMRKAVEQGIGTEDVADAVFHAVDQGRFYVLVPAQSVQVVEVRMQDILTNRLPSLLPI